MTTNYPTGCIRPEYRDATNQLKASRIRRNLTQAAVNRAATALLARIDDITTEEFERGGERAEREALREALTRLAEMP